MTCAWRCDRCLSAVVQKTFESILYFITDHIRGHKIVNILCYLQKHTAITRALDILNDCHGVKYPPQIHSAYVHFETLCNHQFEFECALCGHYPHILILDGNRKCAFRMNGMFHRWKFSILNNGMKYSCWYSIICKYNLYRSVSNSGVPGIFSHFNVVQKFPFRYQCEGMVL